MSERTVLKLMVAVGLGAHLVLIWAYPYAPLVDWPNHMARHYLEARALEGRTIPPGYEIHYSLLPNLGSDLVVPLLLQVFPMTVASRLFLTFSVLFSWLGFSLFVQRQAPRLKAYGLSLLVLPWLLTAAFFWGYLNYASGLGLAFLTFVNYLRLFDKDRILPVQLILHSLLIALLYVWHLAAFGTYVVLHGSHFLVYVIEQRTLIVTKQSVRNKIFSGLAVMLPAGALIVTQKLTTAFTAFEGEIGWRGASGKLSHGLASLLSYNLTADAIVITLWLAAAAAMVRIESLRRSRADWLLLAALIFFILYIILPSNLGTTWDVDGRVTAPLLICIIALLARLPVRRVLVGASIVLIASIVRIGAIYASWESFGEVDAQHLDFIHQLPTGARVLVVTFSQDVSRFKNDVHVIAWAVPERQAMVSSLFAIPGQQLLSVSVNDMGPFAHFTGESMEIDVERVRAASFEYLWCFNPFGRPITVPPQWARVYSAGSITAWKIR
jgi:hypothetical protein